MSVLDKPRLSFSAAARKVGVHISTLHRWRLTGVRGCLLDTIVVGGRRYVIEETLETFIRSMNVERRDLDSDREARADAAGKILDAMGVRLRKEAR